MPRAVDHDQHRAKVIEAAIEIIATDGLPALTFRSLATRLGCSTSVVSHYFSSRTVLLQTVYRAVNREASDLAQQFGATQQHAPVRALGHILPINEHAQKLWRTWLSFWLGALSDPALRDEHRAGLDGARNRVYDYLVGCAVPPQDAATAAEDLLQATLGISMQALFDPAAWPRHRQMSSYQRAAQRVLDQADAALAASRSPLPNSV